MCAGKKKEEQILGTVCKLVIIFPGLGDSMSWSEGAHPTNRSTPGL